ncbi:D-serine ammonia-lyase [Vibrio sp. ABG19]|uniref:D-serine ammonia-lyase n=1 Tax=Vibrio sp. ABG19 TaxID=2817385 RepID=UPI00249E4FE1|nr:D-serine ammonia-lyase [Vibrio sp. ABG19]WGY46826.1 D-serine ammonia-lyase [Vibrio sp. ABG19]
MNQSEIEPLVSRYPLVQQLIQLQETCWFNPAVTDLKTALPDVGLDANDVKAASDRLSRFAPYLMQAFPDTRASQGIIESPLTPVSQLQQRLIAESGLAAIGTVYLKQDSHLPISGSIKARGGIYEVLTHAEKLALQAGLLKLSDDYSKLLSEECRALFARHRIAVGSTGNLGLSIGIMSAKLGFDVTVHMSADAREWKKRKLRAHGVTVVEYEQDYGVAVAQGRAAAESDPDCFFIDDENSKTLFLGYAVAGERLKAQFDEQGIVVDAEHPLFVYLPCGVGGGPGGVGFGLKLAFGDHVHCIFVEPTHSPAMLLGVHTGLHDEICVQDIGVDNKTAADGLAVGRPSGFVGRAMQRLIDGYYTISDEHMLRWLKALDSSEHIRVEPSAAAAVYGPVVVSQHKDYLRSLDVDMDRLADCTHVIWATGGGMVPADEMDKYLA